MTRTAVVAAAALAVIAAFVLIASPLVGSNALTVDAAHWEGSPIVPCFFDAAKCGGHMLGTDENGRDLAARLVVGGGATITTAFLALCIELAIAAALTLASRYGGLIANRAAVAVFPGLCISLLVSLLDIVRRGLPPAGVLVYPLRGIRHAAGADMHVHGGADGDLAAGDNGAV